MQWVKVFRILKGGECYYAGGRVDDDATVVHCCGYLVVVEFVGIYA